MYGFQSESTVYSCLNVKELLSRNRRDIWRLGDSNGIRTHHQLVRKWTLNHLPKWVKWHASIIRPICLNGWEFVYELSGCGFHIVTVTWTSVITPVSSNEWCLGIQPTIECRITLKRVHSMIVTYNQMHCTDKYS